jgi:putative transcriptional regulator
MLLHGAHWVSGIDDRVPTRAANFDDGKRGTLHVHVHRDPAFSSPRARPMRSTEYLIESPEACDVVPGSGGVRKVRRGTTRLAEARVAIACDVLLALRVRADRVVDALPDNVADNISAQVLRRSRTGSTARAKRNIGLEILEGIREIKRGEYGRVTTVPSVSSIRERMGVSQSRSPSCWGFPYARFKNGNRGGTHAAVDCAENPRALIAVA